MHAAGAIARERLHRPHQSRAALREYIFLAEALPRWREIDAKVRAFVGGLIVPAPTTDVSSGT